MSRWLLLGSSNVYNHRAAFIRELEYNNQRKVIKCTSLINFEREINVMDKEFTCLTVSGLDLVLSELRGGVQPPTDALRLKNLEETLQQGLTRLCELLKVKSTEGIKVTIAPLVFWAEFDEKFRKMSQDLLVELAKKYQELYFIPRLSKLTLSEDGVHLQENSAIRYIEYIEKKSNDHWEGVEELDMDIEATQEDRANPEEVPATPANERKGKRPASMSSFKRAGKPAYAREKDLEDVRKTVSALQADLEERQLTDIMFTAKHEEALDELRNERILNRVIFTGVWIQNLNGTIMEKRPKIIEALKKIMTMFLEENQIPDIKFVQHLNARLKGMRQVIEARFETTAEAKLVREAFGRKIKEWRTAKATPEEAKGLGVNMSQTLETRIRSTVLKALAKKLRETKQTMDAYVLQHLPKPLMRVILSKGDPKSMTRTYSYTEAIQYVTRKLGLVLSNKDLEEAYKVAGSLPNLEHKFVLLRSGKRALQTPATGVNQIPIGPSTSAAEVNKEIMNDEESEPDGKKAKKQ